ncbi:GNAT family N-acetyltransferase [Mesorhizobium sp. f-mel]
MLQRPLRVRKDARRCRARLTRPNSEFLVADDGRRIGGMAFAAATTDAKIVMLNQLYVHPTCQRQGIGQALEEVHASFPEARTLRVRSGRGKGLRPSPSIARKGFCPPGTPPTVAAVQGCRREGDRIDLSARICRSQLRFTGCAVGCGALNVVP